MIRKLATPKEQSVEEFANLLCQAPAPSRAIVRRLIYQRHPQENAIGRAFLVQAIMDLIAIEVNALWEIPPSPDDMKVVIDFIKRTGGSEMLGIPPSEPPVCS